jgi:hypothetical protein
MKQEARRQSPCVACFDFSGLVGALDEQIAFGHRKSWLESRGKRGSSSVKQNVTRSLVEIGFILFLFYANLLMGEFEHSGMGEKKGLLWALHDVFTIYNLCIAAIAATVGWLVIEFLRHRL